MIGAICAIATYLDGALLHLFTLAFCICAAAAGAVLIRRIPGRRGSLLWVAALGLCIALPAEILYLAQIIYYAIAKNEENGSVLTLVLGFLDTDVWWPPKELELSTLINKALGPEHMVRGVTQYLMSRVLWLHLPTAACLWAVCGWGGVADRIFGVALLLLAGLTALSAAATAYFMISMPIVTSISPGGGVIDYMYIPEPSWFVYYAVMSFWFVALALLLFRRWPSRSSAMS